MENTARKRPRISIILPVYNGGVYLAETLDTVVMQTFKDWELIVMDAASKDDTLAIAQRYASEHPNIRIISEPDEGTYHAIQKGLPLAHGEFIYILCASDGYLEKRWFEMCMDAFDKDPELSLVWGIPFNKEEDGKLSGPHFATAHFLPGGEGKKWFFKEALKRFSSPAAIVRTLKKFDPTHIGAAKSALKGGKPPQKQDWFYYWLKAGIIFPDNNMCVAKNVLQECLPPYKMGSREIGDLVRFFYNFNSKGYLSHCIPVAANYSRVGRAAQKNTFRARNSLDELHISYFKDLAELRKNVDEHPERMVFRDRTGKALS